MKNKKSCVTFYIGPPIRRLMVGMAGDEKANVSEIVRRALLAYGQQKHPDLYRKLETDITNEILAKLLGGEIV